MARDKNIVIEICNDKNQEWIEHYKCKAKINKKSGKETFIAGADTTKITMIFDIRYSKKIKDLMFDVQKYRIKYNGYYFNILDVDNFMLQNQKFLISGEVINV